MTKGGRRMIAGLARGCHPGPTVAVTALVTALAAAAGRDAGGCLLVGLAVLAGQLSIGWCNDAADAGRDVAAGRSDKPAVDGTITPRALWVAAAVALACCVPLSFASGPLAGAAHLTGVLAAWAYDLGVKATALSWAPYAVGFGVLPAFVTLGLPGEPWPAWWATAAAALLGVGAHLANVLPDLADDLATGVRGWPQRLGAARLRALLPLPLLAATCLLAFGPALTDPAGPAPTDAAVPGFAGTSLTAWTALATAAALTSAGLVLARRRPRAPFLAAIAVAGVDVALLLAEGASLTP
ncbi:UbiA family prenyltransferase [Nonomuraea sp. MCN248]|uniref:UbiA family prenyltransferase n=1 Tax=Nonomuraea corallina TaxID=2989783 RepID=A0ABT4SI25_9ACTN|nr:UbiA family prenyltransferase [Nonomuraea corallina]MDA0636784.1 UbiA family prenyltransferase [Nonomuraea corallina]